MNKFWNWATDNGEHILKLDGTIDSGDIWLEGNDTAELFKAELDACNGENVTVQINSYGGDVFAAAQIYTDLKNYRGKVNVEIILACSAASVIAMAGDTVGISPVGAIMIHDPTTAIFGNSAEMQHAVKMLDTIKQTIINAYELKTNLPRSKISELMTAETWLSAKAALDLHFVDKILFTDKYQSVTNSVIYSKLTAQKKFITALKGRPRAEDFYLRLESRREKIC